MKRIVDVTRVSVGGRVFRESHDSCSVADNGGGGAAGACAAGNADRGVVSLLVHRQLGRQRHQQNHPQQLPVSGHRVSLSHPVHHRVSAAPVASMGGPADRVTGPVLPLVHSAARLREILRFRLGPFQHLEGPGVVRTHW